MHKPYPSSGKPVEPERPPAPQAVLNAIKLMYAGAAVSVVSLVISVIIPLADIAGSKASIKKANPGYTASQVSGAFNLSIEVAVISGVIGTGLWLWMARANGQGRSWARTISTVLFVLATFQLFAVLKAPSPLGVLFTVLIWVIGGGAVFFLWRPESAEFFKPRRLA